MLSAAVPQMEGLLVNQPVEVDTLRAWVPQNCSMLGLEMPGWDFFLYHNSVDSSPPHSLMYIVLFFSFYFILEYS